MFYPVRAASCSDPHSSSATTPIGKEIYLQKAWILGYLRIKLLLLLLLLLLFGYITGEECEVWLQGSLPDMN
jgi:hypothetical protein